MRTTLLAIMIALPTLALVNMFASTITYRRFRKRTPKIRGPEDIQRLRSLAKLQMYLALLAHSWLTHWGVIVVWLFGWLWASELGWLDLLLYGVLPTIVVFIVAGMGQSPARMAKSIPAKDSSLATERDQIVETWIHRVLPDW